MWTFLAILLLLGITLACATIAITARAIIRPPRMTDGKAAYLLHRLSPGDLNLPFENENFLIRNASDNQPLHISGWWLPHPDRPSRCVILLHGYADSKVGAIAWAPMLHQAGFNILAIDLRAHGESGGKYTTGGFFERDDLSQVINDLVTTRPADTLQIVLFGISLGAAVAAAAAATRQDISAVVLESPFTDFRRAIAAHVSLVGLPGGPILHAAIRCGEFLARARFNDVRPIATIPKIRCPILSIIGQNDELLEATDITALEEAVNTKAAADQLSKPIIFPNAAHLMSMQTDVEKYTSAIQSFLHQALSRQPGVATPQSHPAA